MARKVLDNTATFSPAELTEVLEELAEKVAREPPALLSLDGARENALLDLHPGETTIGRDPGCTYPLDQDGLSRNHLKITVSTDFGNAVCEDLGSRNGTWINRQRITGPHPLQRGDLLQIGRAAFKFLPFGDPERLTFRQLREDALTDALTGCFNKGFFNSAMEREVRRSQSGAEKRLSLILFDLDHFKQLNDRFGHDAGDVVLKGVADLVRKLLPGRGEIIARYGGEEFVILLPGLSLAEAVDHAEYLRLRIGEHVFIYDGQRLPVTVSVGVGALQQGFADGISLFREVDAALYRAKEAGRDRVGTAQAPVPSPD